MLNSSKLKELADDNFRFDEWQIVLQKEKKKKTVGKGEIARFSFSHSGFKDLYCRHIKTRACLGKGFFFLPNVKGLNLFQQENVCR